MQQTGWSILLFFTLSLLAAWLLRRLGFFKPWFERVSAEQARTGVHWFILAAAGWFIAQIGPGLVIASLAANSDETRKPPLELSAKAFTFGGTASWSAVLITLWLATRSRHGVETPKPATPPPLKLVWIGLWAFLLWMPLVFLTNAAATFARDLLTTSQPNQIAHTLLSELTTNTSSNFWRTALMIAVCTIVPIAEETVYRGFLLRGIRSASNSNRIAIVLSSLIFTAVHFGSIPPSEFPYAAPTLFTLAIGLAFVHLRTGSLVPCVVIHGLFNALNIFLAMNIGPE